MSKMTTYKTAPWERPSKWHSSTVVKNEAVMTADELAAYLQVSSGVIFELIQHEGLPVIYLSCETYMRFLRGSVTRWLLDREVKCCTGIDALRMADDDEYADANQNEAIVDRFDDPDSGNGMDRGQVGAVPYLKIFRGDE
jgi:hypothetical protein